MLLVNRQYCLDTDDFVIEDRSLVYDNIRLPFIFVDSVGEHIPHQFKSGDLCYSVQRIGSSDVMFIWYKGYYLELTFKIGEITINSLFWGYCKQGIGIKALVMFGIFNGALVIKTSARKVAYVRDGEVTDDSSAKILCRLNHISRSAFLRKVFNSTI